jgi:hypothetical protein
MYITQVTIVLTVMIYPLRKVATSGREEGGAGERASYKIGWGCGVGTRVPLTGNLYCGRFLIEFYIFLVTYFGIEMSSSQPKFVILRILNVD